MQITLEPFKGHGVVKNLSLFQSLKPFFQSRSYNCM